jgi:tetratricopeptide (TPR) repeat protein
MSQMIQTLPWYARLVARLRPHSDAAREWQWQRRLKEVRDAIRERRFDRVEPLLQELERYLESFPPGEDLPPRWNHLADLFQELSGSMQDSERLYRRALALAEAYPGNRSVNVALSLNNLGLLLLHQRRFAEAAPLFEKLLPLMEEQFGTENPEVATCLENLAAAYRGLGRNEDASQRRSRAVSIRRRSSDLLRSPVAPATTARPPRHALRLWTAGLLAGGVLVLGELVLNGVLLAAHWAAVADQLALPAPSTWWLAAVLSLTLLLGPAMLWLYTRLSATLGQDSRTAALTGVAIWFPVFGYTCTWLRAVGLLPAGLLAVTAAWGLGETMLASLLGAWWYRRGA